MSDNEIRIQSHTSAFFISIAHVCINHCSSKQFLSLFLPPLHFSLLSFPPVKQSLLPEKAISAAEAWKVGIEGLRDRLKADEAYLQQIDHTTPQHVIDLHRVREQATETALVSLGKCTSVHL